MSNLSNFISSSFATLAQALAGVSLNALMSPAMTTAVVQYLMQRKNYIVNGAMMVSQENGVTAGTTQAFYAADQWFNSSSMSGFSFATVAVSTPSGSPNRLRYTVTTAHPTPAAGDYNVVIQHIEGSRMVDLQFGQGVSKNITLRFGVKAPAGTYSVIITNIAQTRSIITDYVISASEANTDVVRTITVPVDSIGTWLNTNAGSMAIFGS
jgi:hypothetical protein